MTVHKKPRPALQKRRGKVVMSDEKKGGAVAWRNGFREGLDLERRKSTWLITARKLFQAS